MGLRGSVDGGSIKIEDKTGEEDYTKPGSVGSFLYFNAHKV